MISLPALLLLWIAVPDSQGLHQATGTALDADLYGNLYIVDREKNTLRKFSAEGVQEREIGGPGWENDQFDTPSAVWARNGIDVFVADYGNHRIQRFDRGLSYVSTFSTRDNSSGSIPFGYPLDVAVSRLGDLFICDTENSRIMKVRGQSRDVEVFGGFDAGKGRLLAPRQLEIGAKDRVYVLDGARLMVFDSFGNFVHEIGDQMFPAEAALFADGLGLVVVSGDTIYLFDENDRLVRAAVVPVGAGESAGAVRAVALSQTQMYLLTESGVKIFPNPRGEPGERLTK